MMNKIVFFILFFCLTHFVFAQVGIDNIDPKATLDVNGKPTDASIADGIIAPRISRENLISKTSYSTTQVGAIIYVTDLSGTTNTATSNITDIGYYYFNGTQWKSMNYKNGIIGDIKSGFQGSDHNGWIQLDGRPITSLTPTQQANASSFGFAINLPNATDAYLSQTGSVLGSTAYANTKNMIRANLPDVSVSTSSGGSHIHTIQAPNVTTSSSGAHTHAHNAQGAIGSFGIIKRSVASSLTTIDDFDGVDNFGSGNQPDLTATVGGLNISSNTNHTHVVFIPAFNSGLSGDHDHTFNLNDGVAQESFDVRPLTISVNYFIFLGE